MFGNRRKRATSNPPLNGSNANPSATTAAAQAFLKNRASNASLSSAAAAAALRSRPTTPTSVADVQTKRTMRRSGSTSSMGSSTSTSRPQLERRGSNGSMSERSFRDPSPNRAAQPVPSAADAPPVPTIPHNIPTKSHRRAASLESPGLRVASPPPNRASGRGSSLGPAGMPQTTRTRGQRQSSLSSVSELTSIERPASRGSVNFSLPTSSRPTSPVKQRRLTSPSPQRPNQPRITSPTQQDLVYDPNTRSFLPAAEVHAIEQKLYDVANKPVKKMKRIAPQQATGTYLAYGSVGGKPRGTAIDAMEAESSRAAVERPTPAAAPIPKPTPAPAPVPKKKKKQVIVDSDSDSDQASYAPNSSDNDSDAPRSATHTRLTKKPSIVREDQEREEEEDDTPQWTAASGNLPRLNTGPTRTISPTPAPRSNTGRGQGRGHGRGQASASAAFAQERQHTRSASQPAPAPLDSTFVESIAPRAAKGSVRGGRVQSVSPARTPHFAITPENLQVKHQPPPRSISPRKSALKTSSTPRGPSPNDVDSSAIGQATSETSDDLSVPRKKANRVSFDDGNVAVGQATTPVTTDSPIVQSPQAKRPWYSIAKGKKKDTAMMDDQDDEIMKPRPALPSFGSVRQKKEKPQEEKERTLVKPVEPVEYTEPLASSTIFTTPTDEVVEQPTGQSNDHLAGSILSQDAALKNAANISKSREPLPPQVVSVEGDGFNSDTSSVTSLGIQDSPLVAAKIESGNTAPIADDVEASREFATPIAEEKEGGHGRANGTVPTISILQPTPTLEETLGKLEWPNMPGGWRNSNSHSESSASQERESPVIVEHHVTDASLADVGIAEPDPSTPRSGSPVLGEIAAENSHFHDTPAIAEESEESDTSVYSDAAEDLSNGEGDGFMSLDAVVDSPVIPSSRGFVDIPVPDSPTPKAVKERAYKQSQLSTPNSEPDHEGWEKAQEYWKGLSAEKKLQLEEEARAEAEGSGSDTEVEARPIPTPTKKKKVKVAVAPKTVSEQRQPAHNERSYMITPGQKAGPNGHGPVMRSSMRAEAPSSPSDTHIRQSMRTQNSKRSSLRAAESAEPKGALQKKARPMSYPPPQKGEFVPDSAQVDALMDRMARAAAAAAPAPAPATGKKTTRPASTQGPSPSLRRRGSGDSDSSFKRVRSGSTTSDIPSFRRSMRASNEPHNDSPVGSSRFSLRSLSPTGSTARRPFNSGGSSAASSNPTHMRMSMRSGSGPAPTLRAPARAKSPLRLGFGRSSSSKPSNQRATPKRSSRFADSSDEDDGPSGFRSRFADSDDSDGGPPPLPRQNGLASKSMRINAPSSAPVRSIPKRTGAEDGDSSDLPDSDEEKTKSPTLTQNGIRRSGSGRGAIGLGSTSTTITTVSASGRPPNQRGGSIMSILRRKKADPISKVRKSEVESAARRDTPLERSRSDLDAIRNGHQSPRLQKRNPMSRENSSSWPLPEPGILGKDGRPVTADAVGAGGIRPDLGNRRNTTGLTEVDIAGVTAGLNGVRKKKKFGALRRIFKLDD
ncbi:hypothetical protein LHYA1_G001925 [Lachnellula hyalina]|uniref:Uncharacterized protein n=1 Tax=Lachnellula hyalina TaxID=1316788 RepID=A0A8H8TZU9_9HELO|nr:uncharacterized protein LHYA1_G001925 [Lachnellula hyalina]TVY28569.1 hypothetical protein LHYA1_G001925 [Lachnellula hyalina]